MTAPRNGLLLFLSYGKLNGHIGELSAADVQHGPMGCKTIGTLTSSVVTASALSLQMPHYRGCLAPPLEPCWPCSGFSN